jgi:hypothetical protein
VREASRARVTEASRRIELRLLVCKGRFTAPIRCRLSDLARVGGARPLRASGLVSNEEWKDEAGRSFSRLLADSSFFKFPPPLLTLENATEEGDLWLFLLLVEQGAVTVERWESCE